MRRNNRIWVLPILVLAAAAAWVVWPDNPGLHFAWFNKDFKVVRGLDLVGGLQVLLEADLPAETQITKEQMSTARGIIENRVNGLGVAEPLIQIAGDRRILVELPGIGDTEQAVATIKETGLLEFIEISPQQRSLLGEGAALKTDFGQAPEAVTPVPTESTAAAPATPVAPAAETIFHTVMTGSALKNAGVSTDQAGEIYVAFELTDEGSKVFGEYTSAHIGDLLGIVLDKHLISAPQIQDAITTGSGTIKGNFTAEEANSLAVQLRYGSLPIPLKVAESTAVGPTLGQDFAAQERHRRRDRTGGGHALHGALLPAAGTDRRPRPADLRHGGLRPVQDHPRHADPPGSGRVRALHRRGRGRQCADLRAHEGRAARRSNDLPGHRPRLLTRLAVDP